MKKTEVRWDFFYFIAPNIRIGGRFSMPLILCYQFIHYLSQKTRGKMRKIS